MIDQRIDEQLRRISRAVADTSPEPPALTPGSTRRRMDRRPIRALVVGFAVALVVGLAAVLVATQWISRSDEPTAPAGLGDESRWDWIMDHSEPTINEEIRVADPSATPAPTFDYADLGVEQALISADPAMLAFSPLFDDTALPPLVYVGVVEGTAINGPPVSAYLYRTYDEQTGQTLLCRAVVNSTGVFLSCGFSGESADPGHIISGTEEMAAEVNPPGISSPDLTVDFWLPLNTALVVLRLDDGRTFVQRPIAGMAVIVIQELGDAGIEYAEALDASGEVIVHEDFQVQWEALDPGASWECSPVESETDKVLDAADVPSDIRFLPPVDAFRPDAAWGVNYGQACGRPPALVAVEFADEQRSSVEAMIVVWVEAPSGQLSPPLDTPLTDLFQPEVSTIGGETPESITERDGFILRRSPADQWHKERVDMIGVIDGLPVWIEASGLSPDDLGDYVKLMTASATTGQVEMGQPSERFEVVHSAAVVAETIDHVVWYAEGPGFDIDIQRQPGFDPYGSALHLVGADSLSFVSIGTTIGFVIREGGGTGYLSWEIRPGVLATVLGDGTFEELAEFAELLAPAG